MHPTVILVTVTTAGTRVQLQVATNLIVKMYVEPARANTGRVGIGTSAIVLSTGVGVIRDFEAPGTTPSGVMPPGFLLESGDDDDLFDLHDYWFDSTVSGEKLRVTYWQ